MKNGKLLHTTLAFEYSSVEADVSGMHYVERNPRERRRNGRKDRGGGCGEKRGIRPMGQANWKNGKKKSIKEEESI